jgi:hypothetical protein
VDSRNWLLFKDLMIYTLCGRFTHDSKFVWLHLREVPHTISLRIRRDSCEEEHRIDETSTLQVRI